MTGLPGRERSFTISSAVWIQYTNVSDRQTYRQTDRQTDTGLQQRPRLRIASRGNNIKVRFIPEYKHRKRSYHQYQLLLTHCGNYWRETSKHKSVQKYIINQTTCLTSVRNVHSEYKPDNNISSIDVNKIVNTHANIVRLKLPFTGPRLCSQLPCFSTSTPGKLFIIVSLLPNSITW